MEVPSDILDIIIGSAPSPAEKREDGKRPSRRFPFGSRASVVAIRNGAELPEHTVLLRESSGTEFSFIDDESRNIGEQFSVLFTGAKKGRVKIRCAVTRSEATTEFGTEFIIGASFEEVLEPANSSTDPQLRETAASVAPDAAAHVPSAPRPVSEGGSVAQSRNEPAPPPASAIEVDAPHPAPSRETKTITAGDHSTMPGNSTPANSTGERAAAASLTGAGGGKNQQILSKVLARLAEQEQALRRLEAERNNAMRDCESLRSELTTVSQSLKMLQAKCDADDAAIAELAKLMESETPDGTPREKATAA